MFAPEGYIRWFDLYRELDDWAERIVYAQLLEDWGDDPNEAVDPDFDPDQCIEDWVVGKILHDGIDTFDVALVEKCSNEISEKLDEIYLTTEMLVCTMLSKVLLTFDTLVCTNEGRTTRAPDNILYHIDRLDFCTWSWPIRGAPDYSGFFELFDKGQFPPRSLADRFCFIDPLTGLVKNKNGSRSKFLTAEKIYLREHEVDRFFEKILDPFVGHAIAWNGKNFPQSILELFDGFGVLPTDWAIDPRLSLPVDGVSRIKRRGRKPTGAKKEYFRRYPRGKPSKLSYEAIAAELVEAGFPISARQLQNYEKKRSNY